MAVTVLPTNLEDREPLVEDARLARVEARLRGELDIPEDTEFATFVQPAKTVIHPETGIEIPIPDQAVFIVTTPSPKARHHGLKILHSGTANRRGWDEANGEYEHLVGLEDPLYVIFAQVLPRHLENLQNLKELI